MTIAPFLQTEDINTSSIVTPDQPSTMSSSGSSVSCTEPHLDDCQLCDDCGGCDYACFCPHCDGCGIMCECTAHDGEFL
jgi:hypothetical protein